jgi:23S rRNA (cytidine1920-2'-O)/16S rRNA (cytidine1409-2'-O)-methyltransferase
LRLLSRFVGESGRIRLDQALVARGFAPSRSRARDMVRRGGVLVDGLPEERPARMVAADSTIAATDPAARYVSRAALKLIAALDHFGFDPAGLSALDLGSSTGGFTQVLLERGASHVTAVDVGHGEMDARLAADPRVTLLERLNARHLSAAHLGGRKVEAIVADVSFISLKQALPPALALAEPSAWGVFLVKPQFEVGRAGLGKGGIVRDPELARGGADQIAAWLRDDEGWVVVGIIPSPIAGGSGNIEFLLGARKG